MITEFKTRIAPTPSGLLHFGNGASFLLTYILAQAAGGKILLRIDDLDAERMRLEYVEDIFKTLDWLPIEWDEGPTSVADFQQNWSQHHRLDLYQKALENLKNTEGVLYPCTCSRKQIKEASKNGVYPQTCRFKNISFDQKETAWRMHIPEKTTISFKNIDFKTHLSAYSSFIIHHSSLIIGDFVVLQKNGLPAYQVASVVDDGHFGVNFVVRGADLLPSTAIQIFIAQHLKRTDFAETLFLHHDLVTDAVGEKLSKSRGASSLADWRASGRSSETLIKQAAKWLNLPEIGNVDELIARTREIYFPQGTK
jgi:glutamyl/glutaminyl-tRNA synthetase